MKENIVELFRKYNVPVTFDLLSIDIDGNDYYVLDALLEVYKPRVIFAEFNCSLADKPIIIKYTPDFKWTGDNYFGMSLRAGEVLGIKHGYTLVFQNDGVNMYLVRNDLIKGIEVPRVPYTQFFGFPVSPRRDWIEF